MELFLYYLLFLAIILFTSREVTTIVSGKRAWELTPEFILVVAFLAYTSAMPVSRLLWHSETTDVDIEFMQVNILAALGMLIGLVLGRIIAWKLRSHASNRPGLVTYMKPSKIAVLTVSAVVIIGIFVLYSVGFSVANLLKPYGYERNVLTEQSTRDTLTPPFGIGLILTCFAAAINDPRKRKWPRRLVLGGALILTVLFLARGERNFTLIMWLPIGCLALRGRKVPLFKAAVIGLIVFALYSTVALVRSIGLETADRSMVTLDRMDPALGELGTSFNVYSIFKDIGYSEQLEMGRTYTVDFLTNLVPLAFWRDRPAPTGAKFSMRYYKTDQLQIGLGFSPVVEAEANFTWIGVLPVFTLFSIFVTLLAQYFRGKPRWGVICNAMFLPMIVNWNRIDACASGKLFIVYAGMIVAMDRILYLRGSNNL